MLGFVAALVAVIVLMIVPLVGVWAAHLDTLFGVVIPYLAAAIFFIGVIYRIVDWGKSPVPFKIPTTAGQEKSLDWIKPNWIDNPMTKGAVIIRMAFEVLAFRSLFRNTALDFKNGRAYYSSSKWLWLFAIGFHYAFLAVLVRHLRFFLDPVPFWITWIEALDGFMQLGLYPFTWLPGLYISGVALLGAVSLLFLRRILMPNIRYISMLNDWFPLLLIIHIAATGILMRYLLKVDITAVKELTLSLARFKPVVPEGVGSSFLYASISGQRALRLLPLQQADARPGRLPQPHSQPAQRQPHQAAHQPLEPRKWKSTRMQNTRMISGN